MKIVTYNGSGRRQVKAIFKAMGYELTFVSSLREARLIEFDRLLLLGGRDISPRLYGQKNRYSQRPSHLRDRIELTLLDRAYVDKRPIFGICRGHQMLSVFFGGSLWQDIKIERQAYGHSRTPHKIDVFGKLAKHIPSNKVNSYHHQAVRTIPDGFKALAYSREDSIIESVWRSGVLGVQWHPEYLVMNQHKWIHLFYWFIEGLN